MPNAKTMLAFVILAVPLTACAQFGMQRPSLSGDIAKQFAPVCPTPSQLTPSQAGKVVAAIEATTPEHSEGITILATEWDRLDRGSQICRGAL